MVVEEKLRSKYLYKTLLIILKIIPMITAFGYALNTLFAFIGIDTPLFSNICGMSVLPWSYILLSSYVFKFCAYHKMFLYYILTVDSLNIIDYYIGIINNQQNTKWIFAFQS